MMKTVRIQIEGQVQGVGFRPFSYNLAAHYKLTGVIRNSMHGVDLILQGKEESITQFYRSILQYPPEKAWIVGHSMQELAYQRCDTLEIKDSHQAGQPKLRMTPDIALCGICAEELKNIGDRRYGYAFTSCEQCGPRYSILEKLPFDRAATSMRDFEPCMDCQREYNTPHDRRFYAQTNSCPKCAIALSLWESDAELDIIEAQQIYQYTIHALRNGKLVAVKGIGGYLLLADASSSVAIQKLRTRKRRPTKPFALLYRDVDDLKKDVYVDEVAVGEWLSDAAPIVLFRQKENPVNPIHTQLIAPGLNHLGIMRPYAPILEIISRQFGKPLIATSANEIHSPIIYTDPKALKDLPNIADLILLNNRRIVLPQDDSVVSFTPGHHQRILLRRSRGLAPQYEPIHLPDDERDILCMGALLKSSFAIRCRNNVFISQYLGNTLYLDAQQSYEYVLEHLLEALQCKPAMIVVDMHPEYFTTQLGKRLARALDVSLRSVQHHKAHFAAVLAEHDLLLTDERILGVVWDGTGYGDDGCIWGGEFFLYEQRKISRIDHFTYYDQLFGDKMIKEPRLSALSLTKNLLGAERHLKPHFSESEWDLYHKYITRNDNLQTSSVGRIFDAVAFLLGIRDEPTYEGESAVRLQMLATEFDGTDDDMRPYTIASPDSSLIFQCIIEDLERGLSKQIIAYKFHLTLADLIGSVASQHGCRKIAVSGGVFQNSLLIDLLLERLSGRYALYFHEQLSPNDENIALGQLSLVLCEQIKIKEEALSITSTKEI